MKQAERDFQKTMPLLARFLIAAIEVILSNSELLCYFAMVVNAMVYASILSLIFPISTFLWAMMASPRPSKAYWLFAITYTEVWLLMGLACVQG